MNLRSLAYRGLDAPFGRTVTKIGPLQYAVLTTKLIETCPMTVIGTFSHAVAPLAASRMILPFVSFGPSSVLLPDSLTLTPGGSGFPWIPPRCSNSTARFNACVCRYSNFQAGAALGA